MYNENEIELTAEEQAQLSALPREMPVGDLLEERIVRALRSNGQLGSMPATKRSPFRVALRIAAAIALFAGGVATGRYLIDGDTTRSASTTTPQNQVIQPQTTQPGLQAPPAGKVETIVAEREMWL